MARPAVCWVPARPRALIAILLMAGAWPIAAQSTADEPAVRAAVARFELAWNTHDMRVLGELATDDVDFVNVSGAHWKGREQVVREHAARHATRFKTSVWTTKTVGIQFLRPDLALVHIDWETRGDLDFDLKPWPPRKGIFSWLMVKTAAGWKLRSAHNTDTTAPVLAPPKL